MYICSVNITPKEFVSMAMPEQILWVSNHTYHQVRDLILRVYAEHDNKICKECGEGLED